MGVNYEETKGKGRRSAGTSGENSVSNVPEAETLKEACFLSYRPL